MYADWLVDVYLVLYREYGRKDGLITEKGFDFTEYYETGASPMEAATDYMDFVDSQEAHNE